MGYLGGLPLAGDEAHHRLLYPCGGERVSELRGGEAPVTGQDEQRRRAEAGGSSETEKRRQGSGAAEEEARRAQQ